MLRKFDFNFYVFFFFLLFFEINFFVFNLNSEQVWNSLSEAHDTQREKSNSNSKLDQLLHSQPKTQIEQIRVPSFTKHTVS